MPVILALRDHRVFRKPDRERDRTKKKTPSPRGTAHNEKKRKRARERTGREFALFPPRASAKRRKTSRLNVNRINTVVFNKCRFACKLGASCLLFVSRIGNASYPSCSATRSYVDLHFRGAARAETPPPPRPVDSSESLWPIGFVAHLQRYVFLVVFSNWIAGMRDRAIVTKSR